MENLLLIYSISCVIGLFNVYYTLYLTHRYCFKYGIQRFFNAPNDHIGTYYIIMIGLLIPMFNVIFCGITNIYLCSQCVFELHVRKDKYDNLMATINTDCLSRDFINEENENCSNWC